MTEDQNNKPPITWQGGVAIPDELDSTLFFMWANGVSYGDIVDHYKGTPLEFNKDQLYRYASRKEWKKRKAQIDKEVKQDFKDILKQCQSKKMSAIAMAISTVSEIIIKDVTDYKSDPENFWKEVREYKRPRPFWMARNVDELTNLYKLQKFLELSEEGGNQDQQIPEVERAAILKALADSQRIPTAEVQQALPPPGVTDAEFVEVKDDDDDQSSTDRPQVDQKDKEPSLPE